MTALEKKIINSYTTCEFQKITINSTGKIIALDNNFFNVEKNTSIFDCHPFFHVFTDFLSTPNKQEIFELIQLEKNEKIFILDIVLYTGNEKETPFIYLFNRASYHKEIQQIVQNKNELFIEKYRATEKNKQLEEEKQLKNELLIQISRDLKTPLNGIAGLMELFKSEKLSPNQKELATIINGSLQHINRLVNDVFNLSKTENNAIKIKDNPFSIKDITDNINYIYTKKFAEKEITFTLKVPRKIPKKVIGDYDRVYQIIYNLLEHAHNGTTKGQVVFKVTIDTLTAKKVWLKFEIEHYSETKNSHNLQQLQTNTASSLAIIKQFVNLLNGKLSFCLDNNDTYNFTVVLPLEIERRTFDKIIKKPIIKTRKLNKKLTILIVDDNEINQLVIMKMLINNGSFYIDIASNEEEVITLVNKENYDILIIDWAMLHLSSNKNINKVTQNIKTLALSSYHLNNEEIRQKKISDYLLKPFDEATLMTKIYTLVEE